MYRGGVEHLSGGATLGTEPCRRGDRCPARCVAQNSAVNFFGSANHSRLVCRGSPETRSASNTQTHQRRPHRPASVALPLPPPRAPSVQFPPQNTHVAIRPEPILKNSATPRLRGGKLAGPSKRPTSMLRSAQIPAVGKQRRSSTLGDPSHTPRRPLTPSSTPHPPYTHTTPPAHS